jgi:hypothetical protein
VDGIRLQVYRHIAHPASWTAYAYGFVNDVLLEAKELDDARQEAIAVLEEARAQSSGQQNDPNDRLNLSDATRLL